MRSMRRCSVRSRSNRRWPRPATPVRPVAIDGIGEAAEVFRTIADRIATDIAPVQPADEIDMAGCSARLFDTVNAAFADLDAATERRQAQ